MKKYLLSTSALASVALISSLASAEVEFGGKVEFDLKSGDTHGGQSLVVDDADLFISGSTTTDGGLEVSGKFNIESGGIDDVELLISGGFGTVKFHDGDTYAGAAGALGIYAASVAAGSGGVDGNAGVSFSPSGYGLAASSDNGTAGVDIYPGFGSGNANSITYLSNDFSGVTFGATLYFGETGATDPAAGLNEDGDDVEVVDGDHAKTTTGQEIAIAYNADFDFGSLGVSFTSATRDTEEYGEGFAKARTEETSESKTSFGLMYSMAGVSFVYAQIDTDNPEDKAGDLIGPEASSTHLGLAYNFGAGNVSYTSITTDYTKSTGAEVAGSAESTVFSFDYSLGEGVTLTADLADATNVDLDSGLEDGGTSETVLGVVVSF